MDICCILICNKDTMITTTQSFRKIYLSLYLKGLCVRGSRRLNRTATYWPLHSIGHQCCVFLILQGCSTGSPEAQLSAGCCFLYSIISPSLLIPKLNRGSWRPLLLGASFLYHILSPTGLVSKNSIGDPEGPFCWVLVFSTASCLQLIEFPVHSVI